MEKKQFKAESQRLMDLMINSIYTHKEIFLREIISNASDAIDKLAYRALTDEKVGLNREDFKIVVVPDKEARTLTVADNGIGMTQEEMENNLGTIAKSGSLQFKKETENADDAELDIIGQFGVGFYSAFMVADHITVISRKYGREQAYRWESDGLEGYTIEPCARDAVGTDIIMHIKPDGEEKDEYSQYLREYPLYKLVKKYSDYIRFPIKMLMPHPQVKEGSPEDKPEYEEVFEWETLNSMVPLWQRRKSGRRPMSPVRSMTSSIRSGSAIPPPLSASSPCPPRVPSPTRPCCISPPRPPASITPRTISPASSCTPPA